MNEKLSEREREKKKPDYFVQIHNGFRPEESRNKIELATMVGVSW